MSVSVKSSPLYRRGSRLASAPDADVVLLHSRYRPPDRVTHTTAALSPPGLAGKIVVSTQVLEAGIDLSAALLFTEAAPWPSVVQRAGRCNRDGMQDDARMLWATPPTHHPYEEVDVSATAAVLRSLAGARVTTTRWQCLDVRTSNQITPIVRRRDLIDLFDTTPDLSGDDVDVARFIRDRSDRTVQVAHQWSPPFPGARCSRPRRTTPLDLADDSRSPTSNQVLRISEQRRSSRAYSSSSSGTASDGSSRTASIRARRSGSLQTASSAMVSRSSPSTSPVRAAPSVAGNSGASADWIVDDVDVSEVLCIVIAF